jgi:hypothetical protein
MTTTAAAIISVCLGVFFGIACYFIARSKARNAVGYFFLGLFFGIFGLIITAVIPNLNENKKRAPSGRSQITASWLNQSGQWEKGRLRATDSNLEFMGEDGVVKAAIPFNTISNTIIYDGKTLPTDFPNREAVLKGKRLVLGVGHTVGGSEYGSYFSAGTQMKQFVRHRLEPTLSAVRGEDLSALRRDGQGGGDKV